MQLVIKNASITGVSGTRDISIDAGRITAVDPRVEGQADREIDAAGNLVSTGFVDSHMHLDKALVLDRYDWSQRETLVAHRITAMTESDKMKRDFTVDDVRQRAVRLARMCAAYGTTTLRSHVDIDTVVGLVGMEGVLAAKKECRGLVDIQISPYAIRGFEGQPQSEPLLRQALEMGADLVGGVPEADDDPVAHVDRIFSLAREFGLDIDFHTDQVSAARPFALPYIAEKTMADGMQGRVMASHCRALGYVSTDEHQQVIELCARAGVNICVTPFECMHERVALPRQAGVNVTYMSDNIQDAWRAHGNGDMMLLAVFASRLTPFNTNQELDAVLEIGTLGAARSLGFAGEVGVAVGRRADLMVLDAPSAHDAVLYQARRLWVIKAGRIVAADGKLVEDSA
jgi:cytosine deaminase